MTIESSQLLSAALSYAAEGCSVFPCEPRGKSPITSHGLKDASNDPAIIKQWWGQNPTANIGLVTGLKNGLAVLDIDGEEGEQSLARLVESHGPIPTTRESKTGRGRQFFFQHPDPAMTIIRNTVGKVAGLDAPGLDIRGEGGYVIVPPSIHPNGQIYTWVNATVDPAPMMNWMMTQATNPTPLKAPDIEAYGPARTALLKRAADYARAVPGEKSGGRNDAAFRLAGKIKAIQGPDGETLGEADILAIVGEWNANNDPPLDAAELAKAIRSGLTNGTPRAPKPPPPPQPDLLKSFASRSRVAQAKSDPITGNDRPSPLAIARDFLDNRTASLMYWGGHFLLWQGGQWTTSEDPEIRGQIYNFCARQTKSEVDTIVDALKSEVHLPQTNSPPCWLDDKPGLPPAGDVLACRNGLVNLPAFVVGATDHLIPPTPLYFNQNTLAYGFAPDAPVPAEWLAFLNSLWPDDPQAVALLQEWFGYCLTGDTSQQKMMLLYGPKRSGKGTIASILTGLLGAHNVAGPTLASLSSNFGLQCMIGKPLAIISDARLSGRSDSAVIAERLLSISGEDAQTIDRKYQDPITLKLPTRIMILTNELPRLVDSSGALASRFLILRLTKSFYGVEDTGLTDKLLAELPGILLWAIEGWRRLHQQGKFTTPASSAEDAGELDELGSPVGSFVQDRCDIGPDESVLCDRLFKEWSLWALDHGHQPGKQEIFGRDLKAAFPAIRRGQKRIGDGKRTHYFGVGIAR